jgi:hypothetical protein
MHINGIWKGEYYTRPYLFETGKEIRVPFLLRIRSINELGMITIDDTLFEGMCQDDPDITNVNYHATVTGALRGRELYFVKQYAKLLVRRPSSGLEAHEGLHPEIYFSGRFDYSGFKGEWHTNRTFRKIDGKLCELAALKGVWSMEKLET